MTKEKTNIFIIIIISNRAVLMHLLHTKLFQLIVHSFQLGGACYNKNKKQQQQ